MKTSKKFRVVTEGATVDGRNVQRNHIQEMADSYNLSVYGARINLEHFVSVYPDSVFRCYGDVMSASAVEIKDGPLAGKLSLEVVIKAEEKLVSLFGSDTTAGQKIFPSIEYISNFAGTGKAYLVGLGFTDTPASIGTEIAKFSRLPADHMFAIGEEITALEFSEEQSTGDNQPSIFSRVTALFSKRDKQDGSRFSEIEKAIELTAQHQQGVEDQLSKLPTAEALTSIQTKFTQLETDLAAMKTQLAKTDGSEQRRPISTGAAVTEKTDC